MNMTSLLLLLIVVLSAVLVYVVIRLNALKTTLAKKPVVINDEEEEQKKAMIRHDLKGTLNRIFALSRLIPMSGPVNEAQQEYLTKIETQCKEGLEEVNRALPRRPLP